MLNGDRHKRVRHEGYLAGLAGKGENPYSILGAVGQVYAAIWDAGYTDGQEKSKTKKGEENDAC